jgi:nicotinate phosphoribosyltransferase
LSRDVRRILDTSGLPEVKIFVSGGFDEFKIAAAVRAGAPIDAFGVGTNVGVSADAPSLDIVYKMVRYDGRNVRKLSPGKTTLAGEKQVFRRSDENGVYLSDTIGLRGEDANGRSPLLASVMKKGAVTRPHDPLELLRDRCRKNLKCLPQWLIKLEGSAAFPVDISPGLERLQS